MSETILRIVTIFWPEDPDRGMEAYGPFDSVEEQSKFVDDCQAATARGWSLLENASYLIHRVAEPFDPTQLAISTTDEVAEAMRADSEDAMKADVGWEPKP
jgi:hypothetical protein